MVSVQVNSDRRCTCLTCRHIAHSKADVRTAVRQKPTGAESRQIDPAGQHSASADVHSHLLSAFISAPQEVLSVCGRCLEDGRSDLCQGAELFVSNGLLAALQGPPPQQSGAASTAVVPSIADVLKSLQGVKEWIKEAIENGENEI